MATDTRDWNYDRIVTAKAQIDMVINDMLTVLRRGHVTIGMKNRMCEFLRNAADDLERMDTGK